MFCEHHQKVGGRFFVHVESLCVSDTKAVGLNHVKILQIVYEGLFLLQLALQDGHNGVVI